jgi:hypothetical protein
VNRFEGFDIVAACQMAVAVLFIELVNFIITHID